MKKDRGPLIIAEWQDLGVPPMIFVLYTLIRPPVRRMTRDITLPQEITCRLVMVLGSEWLLKFVAQQIVSYKECIHTDNTAANKAVSFTARHFSHGYQGRSTLI